MNKKIMKKIIATLTLSAVLFTVGCVKKDDKADGGDKKNKIIVATSADYPPYEFHANIDGEDVIVGFDIEIAKEIAKDMNVELEIKDMDFDGLLAALASNKADMVIAGMTPTEDRKQNADFSKIYYTATHGIVMNKDSADSVKALEDLNGKVVGVQQGSIQADMAKEKVAKAKEIKEVAKITDLVLMLKTGKVDAIIMEKPVAESYVKSNNDIALTSVEVTDETGGSAIAFKKGNTELVEQANKTIDRLISEGKIDQFLTEANKLAEEQKDQ
jgi:polar amino acid transport system substrate-binding protein